VAQAKFVHTVSAGYTTGAMFKKAISSFFLLRGKHIELARRSMVVAASFGLASALSVVVLGDESGYVATEQQKMKIAALEAMWETEPAPAGLTLFAIPGKGGNRFEVKIPWVLGLITTRSLNTELPGIHPLVDHAEQRIRNGILASADLDAIRKNPTDKAARADFAQNWHDLGYALLLKRYRDDVQAATPEEIRKAALDTIPDVSTLFWSFRIMVGLGFYMILFFATAFVLSARHRLGENRTLLRIALWSLPVPWIAIESGWLVAEYGRQPWAIEGVLPTFYAASGLTLTDLAISLGFFLTLYTSLLIVMVILMVKTIKAGPSPEDVAADVGDGALQIPKGAFARPER
jgi:cytochrome d ubiquinol oxidase subunit I